MLAPSGYHTGTELFASQPSGTIKTLYVDFNSPVKKDQILAQIDPATFQAQVDQARANLSAARANVEKAQAALLDAPRTLDRNTTLYQKNYIAKSELDADTTWVAGSCGSSADSRRTFMGGKAIKGAAEQALSARSVQNDARIRLRRHRESDPSRKVRLDEARDDVRRGALRRDDHVDARRAPELGDAADGILHLFGSNHHEVGELVYDDDKLG